MSWLCPNKTLLTKTGCQPRLDLWTTVCLPLMIQTAKRTKNKLLLCEATEILNLSAREVSITLTNKMPFPLFTKFTLTHVLMGNAHLRFSVLQKSKHQRITSRVNINLTTCKYSKKRWPAVFVSLGFFSLMEIRSCYVIGKN